MGVANSKAPILPTAAIILAHVFITSSLLFLGRERRRRVAAAPVPSQRTWRTPGLASGRCLHPARMSAIKPSVVAVLLAVWAAVAHSPADAHCVAIPNSAVCQSMRLAEARTPLDFINPKTECRRFEPSQEARNVRDWNALDIVPMHVPVPTEAIEAELQRVGGMRLVLRVDAEIAKKQLIERGRDDVRGLLREAKIPLAAAAIVRGDAIETRIKDDADLPQTLRALLPLTSRPFPVLELRNAGGEGDARRLLSLAVTPRRSPNTWKSPSRMQLNIYRGASRIWATSGRWSSWWVKGESSLSSRASRIPNPCLGPCPVWQGWTFKLPTARLIPALRRRPPTLDVVTDDKRERSLLVKRRIVGSGSDVVSAVVARDPHSGAPAVAIRFGARASRQLQAATRDNREQLLAVLLSRQVIAAPIIREPLETGAIWISGAFTLQQAKDLAVLVRARELFGAADDCRTRDSSRPRPSNRASALRTRWPRTPARAL